MQRRKSSIYTPYYAKIQGLIYDGMTVRQIYEYMEYFFDIYADIRTLYKFIQTHKLYWYKKITIQKEEGEDVLQKKILDFIVEYIEKHQYAPTTREIGEGVGLKSTSSVFNYVSKMIKSGDLETDETKPGTARAIRVPGYKLVRTDYGKNK